MYKQLGVVIIGRNEGERLRRCLGSLLCKSIALVYVDSGSSDDSVAYAESLGVDTVSLDKAISFSAARARNEGFFFLCGSNPAVEYIQFIDGDCELADGWIDTAVAFLENYPEYAIACGRIRERFPDSTVYNLLCNIEWNTPGGDIDACGGVFLVRRAAFERVGGFNAAVVAGEESELCYRLRQFGNRIYRLDHEMALHDADMTTFSQWFKRTKRTGHAYAQGYFLQRGDRQGFSVKQSAKIWLWSLLFPFAVVVTSFAIDPRCLWLATIYVFRLARIAIRKYRQVGSIKRSLVYSLFTILAPWPQLVGQLMYIHRSLLQRTIYIIEHK